MNNKTEKSAVIERLRALRARAEDDASSPAEVAACAARAARLMRDHDIAETELEIEREEVRLDSAHGAGRQAPHLALFEAGPGIQALCEVRVLWRRGGEMVIVGLSGDREFALYICNLVRAASDRGWKALLKTEYQHSTASTKSRARRCYMMHFGHAVACELFEMADKRKSAKGRGTDLVVVKDAVVRAHLDKKYGEIPEAKPKTIKAMDVNAAIRGHLDGQDLDLDRPLESSFSEDVLLG